MAELTPWLPGHTKPIRPGIYQRQFPDKQIAYAHWSGTRWYCASVQKVYAMQYFKLRFESAKRDLPWRGLAEKAK